MAWQQAIGELSAANEGVEVPIVQPGTRRVAVARLSDTFVGTVKIQSKNAAGAYSDETVVDMADGTTANPTTVGNYSALIDASAVAWRVLCSAYTSGTIRVETSELPQSA